MEYSECLPFFESVTSVRIRRAEIRDLSWLVSIHSEAFPNAFLTLLGSAFLAQYYSAVLADDGGVLLVAIDQTGIVGFVAGILEPRRFYDGMRSHVIRYAMSIVAGLIRRPYLIGKICSSFRRLSKGAARCADVTACELTSIAVLPESQGRGFGRNLVRQFLLRAWASGADSVYLSRYGQQRGRQCTLSGIGLSAPVHLR